MLIAVCVYKWNTYLLNKIAMVLNQRIKQLWKIVFFVKYYSHFSNSRGGWNKHGGGAKVSKSINMEGGMFWKKLVHKCNKCGVEGGKNLRNQ